MINDALRIIQHLKNKSRKNNQLTIRRCKILGTLSGTEGHCNLAPEKRTLWLRDNFVVFKCHGASVSGLTKAGTTITVACFKTVLNPFYPRKIHNFWNSCAIFIPIRCGLYWLRAFENWMFIPIRVTDP